MMRTAIFISVLALATPATAREPLERVPFVGCPADGQTGPIPPPNTGKTPKLPRQVARQLAFYGYEGGPGALAPRGWHCIALYGANGSFLVITPERHTAEEFFKEESVAIRGPAVQISAMLAGTSGRLEVMPVIARYFPRYRPYMREVESWDPDVGPLPTAPYKTDVIRKRTAKFLRFTTPAGRKGEGTNSRLLPADLPIDGIRKIVGTADEPDLLSVEVRLPSNIRDLAPMILSSAAK